MYVWSGRFVCIHVGTCTFWPPFTARLSHIEIWHVPSGQRVFTEVFP